MARTSWNYTFQDNSDTILNPDTGKAREVASYLQQNPASQITLSGSDRRHVDSVGQALRNAGVPASRFQPGMVTDPNVNDPHRVDVIVSN
jgi:outer membrane protein OmpA-like peptidoglycan-associated protein